MNYKQSHYNLIVPRTKNETIIFNGLTGAIGKVSSDVIDRLEKCELLEDEVHIFLKKGVIVPEDFNELNKILVDRANTINSPGVKHFRVWPTSKCNARCYFCFEKGIRGMDMTPDVADDVIKYIGNSIFDGDKIEFEWFGGEPLLRPDIIDRIITGLKPICQKKNCTISNGMLITNGRCITKELIYKMKNEWNITSVQISMEGCFSDYNQIKDFIEPDKYDFLKIISNVRLLVDSKIHVSFRMNYDTHNFESLVNLIEYMHDNFSNYDDIYYYVYPVWSSSDSGYPDAFESKTVADHNILKLFELLVEYGMNDPHSLARLGYKVGPCKACCKDSFVILPDGKISKCSEAYMQIIGNIREGIQDYDTYNSWVNYDPGTKCKQCKYLPLCQGGCMSSRFNRMPQCFAYKPIINDLILWYSYHLDKERKKSILPNE